VVSFLPVLQTLRTKNTITQTKVWAKFPRPFGPKRQERQTPNAKRRYGDTPSARRQMPNADTAIRQAPSAKRQTPIRRYAKRQAPNAKRRYGDTPSAKRQAPNAKRQTPIRSPLLLVFHVFRKPQTLLLACFVALQARKRELTLLLVPFVRRNRRYRAQHLGSSSISAREVGSFSAGE
jgi:hypothetical protein